MKPLVLRTDESGVGVAAVGEQRKVRLRLFEHRRN